jgi:hypothetical protein
VHPQLVIERFLSSAREPVLFEPGEDPLPIRSDSFLVARHGTGINLECWNDQRNLVRRVRAVKLDRPGRVELEVERFGGRVGALTLVDLADPHNRDAGRRGARLKYRERFRRALSRQYPDWRVAELSTDADLHHSLSPSYPRAFLRKGSAGFAAIGAAEDALDPGGALSFGLIWLDYLRGREKRLSIEGLALFLPAGQEHTTCHRVRHLDPRAARYAVFVHTPDAHETLIDPQDYTNFDTRLDPFLQPLAEAHADLGGWMARLASAPHVQRRDHPDGSVSLAVHGLEFARAKRELQFGIDRKHVAGGARHLEEIAALVAELARLRGADAEDRLNPLYARDPESWLESQVRASLERIDAMLLPAPIHGQAPQFAAGERGLVDLLAVDRAGRLAVIEIKATEDIHLPLQALDYWMRVKWHLDRGEFAGRGYFPGVTLAAEAPRLLLIAPALEYHPTNEIVLRFFAREVEVERYGVGIDWRRDLRVMFRRTHEAVRGSTGFSRC